jgi:hypothetical protein
MKKMTAEITAATFIEDDVVEFDNYIDDAKVRRVQRGNALTFGYSVFDKLLLPPEDGAPSKGSLLLGDSTILMAPINIGKSTAMQTVGIANVKLQRDVLYIPLEGNIGELKLKLWCGMLNVSENQWFSMMKTEKGVSELNVALAWLKRYFVFHPFVKAGGSIEDVEVIVRRRQEELFAEKGKFFDLVIIDYPAVVGTRSRGG